MHYRPLVRPLRLTLLTLVFAASAAHADTFRILDDPRDAAQARVDIIQQARQKIDAVYFIARNDRIALTALELLRDAHRRGVESVRLIVDANFNHIPQPVLAYLIDEGVQVRVYHPLTVRHLGWIFHRMHEKLVVVDGQRYITGGRNLDEAYFGLAKHNFIDRDVYVDGASATDAEAHFERLWNSRDVVGLQFSVSDAEKAKAAATLDNAARSFDFVRLNTGTDWSAGQPDIPSVRFLHDPVESGERLGERVDSVLAGAQTSIVIESPYFVPTRSVRDVLLRKLHDGVRVELVTNSLRSTDGVLPWVGYLKYRRRFVLAGAKVHEYKGPDTLHAKSVVVDDHKALIGSLNFDRRSYNLDSEELSEADDVGIASKLTAAVDRHVQHAWLITAHPHRIHVPRMARLRAWIARVLLPLFEPQL